MRSAPPRLDRETLDVLRSGLRIVALRSLGDLEAAEEAAQETLVRGLEALEADRLHNPENPGAYFRGILRHVIADTLKHRKRTVSLERLPDYPDPDPSSDALLRLISEEQKAKVVRVLAELSPQARECLRLSFFQGLPPREVALRLGEPSFRIRKRRSRALKQIRKILEQGEDAGRCHESDARTTEEVGENVNGVARNPGSGDET